MYKSNTRKVNLESNEKAIPPKDKPIQKILDDKSTEEWKHINWRKLEKRVYKLQKRIYGGTHDKRQFIEEPDDAKVSRPVLKTSGLREEIA